jgi:hypothetical protein
VKSRMSHNWLAACADRRTYVRVMGGRQN